MSNIISGEKLTDYQRWEPPGLEDPSTDDSLPAPRKPTIVQSKDALASTNEEPTVEASEVAHESQSRPKLGDIEDLQQQAQEEGFASGYQEGRKEGKEQGFQKGHEKGYQEGHHKGYQEGLEHGREEALVRIRNLDEILTFMENPLQALDTDIEQELARLATTIAGQLVRRELKLSPGEIIPVVREAISLLPALTQGVTLVLHPDDSSFVREVLGTLAEERGWRIQDDPSLTRGGCRVETEVSRIDATVEKRLGAVIANVLGDERRDYYE